MIPTRVLPHVPYNLLGESYRPSEALDFDVQTMLKAGIWNIVDLINRDSQTLGNINLEWWTLERNNYRGIPMINSVPFSPKAAEIAPLNLLAGLLNTDNENTNYQSLHDRKISSELEPELYKVDRGTVQSRPANSNFLILNPDLPESGNSPKIFDSKHQGEVDSRPIGYEGFRLLTPEEKRVLFDNKRDDLYYKTFGRDVRKFLQDDFIEHTGYNKEVKGKDGTYFYNLLSKYAKEMRFAKGQKFSNKIIVCYLGSLINHREFKKAWPKDLLPLSKEVYNTFNLFTKEKLYSLCKAEEFKVLFKYYVRFVSKENDFLRLREHKIIGENLGPYLFVYNEFCRVWLL